MDNRDSESDTDSKLLQPQDFESYNLCSRCEEKISWRQKRWSKFRLVLVVELVNIVLLLVGVGIWAAVHQTGRPDVGLDGCEFATEKNKPCIKILVT
jgi:hypothetical protein